MLQPLHWSKAVLCAAAMAAFLAAASPMSQSMPVPAASAKAIAAIEGVYNQTQKTAAIVPETGEPGPEYSVEDIIEIVRYDDAHVYFRAVLHFFNAHSCSIYGIAKFEDGAFVYTSSAVTGEDKPPCRLTISTTKTDLVIDDLVDGRLSCKAYCGVRGGLADHHIPRSRRRPIKYMTILKNSRQYAEAMQEWKEKQ